MLHTSGRHLGICGIDWFGIQVTLKYSIKSFLKSWVLSTFLVLSLVLYVMKKRLKDYPSIKIAVD